ncbi:MAG TPA: putative nucleotidyltransferase substrate binding domain-containing protein, partial [Vicinamibacterales bacterium]|nr:putative nucleotidyltransferase substrate binding domain-containing protein [Vicinamibacterales bacterium]
MNPSDLFLSPDLTEEQARAYLQSLGFRDAAAVDGHLQRMADDMVVREALGRLAPDLLPAVLESPNPDAAIAAMAHYVAARSGRAMFLDYLREDPRALHVLSYVLGASPQLADILVRTPEYFHWLVTQVERSAPDRQDHEEELVSAFATVDDSVEGLNMLRRWKRRETLRIGTRDLLRHETVQTATAQLSDIAAVVVDFALAIVMQQLLEAESREKPPGTFAVIGTGRVGGRQMGYDDDIDVLYVYDRAGASDDASQTQEFFVRVGRDLTAALRDDTHDGSLYNVRLPEWPQADGWLKACSIAEYVEHFASADNADERLALTRARTIAGDADLGARFLASCQPHVYRDKPQMRDARLRSEKGAAEIDLLTRRLQLVHGARHASLRYTGTLDALDALAKAGVVPEQVCRELDHAYVFLRTAEHRQQLGLIDADLEKQAQASQARV